MLLSVIVPSLTGKVPQSLKEDPRLEVIVVTAVKPVAAARNVGLARATGEYVAWVDADDEVADDWLEAILRGLAERPDVLSFNARVEWHDGSGRKPYAIDGRRAGQLWCKVFRRSLFDGLQFEGAVHEDWRIQCQMPKNLRRTHVDRELYVYQRHADGLSQHRDAGAVLRALWGLLKICNSWTMFCGICERAWDFAKTPLRKMFRR